MSASLLKVENLRTVFQTPRGVVTAVDGLSFSIQPGETVGLVGESGCGKSTVALSLLRLIRSPGEIVAGKIELGGRNLRSLSEAEMRKIRGGKIAMVFQEPGATLNPVMTIGTQIVEAIQAHFDFPRRKAWRRGAELLGEMGIRDPGGCMKAYPERLSGGMKQRALIAIALSCEPLLLIGDEPTTALDVTIQAQILDLLRRLKQSHNLSLLVISHDWGVIAEMADRVVVMYAGEMVECGTVDQIFHQPSHPYTCHLLQAFPRLRGRPWRAELGLLEGSRPDLLNLPGGCRFQSRCPEAVAECLERHPQPLVLEPEHQVRCLRREQASNMRSSGSGK
ncbi:MAG: ABC transporter ATP-binding protein [Acidobacteriota bacterium]